MKPKICALIIARGGSKRIKNKNIRLVKKNKPTFYFSINEAAKSKKINRIFFMTDSDKIANKVKSFNFKKTEVIGRSKKSATGLAQSEIAINEFVKNYDYDIIFFIQLTNIFIKTKDIDKSLDFFQKNDYDSLLSVIESDKFIWKKNKDKYYPTNYNLNKRPLKKSLKDTYYLENGSFYIFTSKGFRSNSNRLFGKIGTYKMGKESYFDIDTIDDLRIAAKITM